MTLELKKRKGITLIELLIALALMSVVLLVSYSIFSSGWRGFNKQIDNVDNQSKARQAIGEISQEIRKVNAVDIEIDGSSINVDGTKYSFQQDTNTLLKDEKEFITGIESFEPKKEDNMITLEITTLTNRSHGVTLTSSVYIRE